MSAPPESIARFLENPSRKIVCHFVVLVVGVCSNLSVIPSKRDSCSHLHCPGRARSADHSESGAAEGVSGQVEIRVIQRIQDLSPELHANPLGDAELVE